MANNPFATILGGGRLSNEESTELAAQVAQLTRSGLSLEAGLRATAEELGGGRLSRVLNGLAAPLEVGQSLDAALESQKAVIPAHLRGLIVAGVRTGRLAEMLEQYVVLQRRDRETRRRLRIAMAYPSCLLVLLGLVFLLFRFFTFAPFMQLYRELDLTSSTAMIVVQAVCRYASLWLLPGVLLLLVAVPVIGRLAAGQCWASWLLRRIPTVGPLTQWNALSRFSHLMELLVENQTPLPEALRLTADGVEDAALAGACREAAGEVEAGRGLCDSLARQSAIPARLIPLFDWGERTSSMGEAFGSASEMCDSLLATRASVTQSILMPIVSLATLVLVGLSVLLFYIPFINLGLDFYELCFAFRRRHHINGSDVAEGAVKVGMVLLVIAALALVVWILYLCWMRFGKNVFGVLGNVIAVLWGLGGVLLLVGPFLPIPIKEYGTSFDLESASAFWCVTVGPFFVLWFLISCLIMELLRQRRIVRQYGLLWLIMVSAERGIPLAPAIEAFGRESGGRWRWRVRSLARQLTAGIPLPQALENLGGLLPRDILPLVRVGCEAGELPRALRKSAASRLFFHSLRQSVASKVFYLALPLIVGCGCAVFLWLKIVPELGMICHELQIPIPAISSGVLHGVAALVSSLFGRLLIGAVVFVGLYAMFRAMGVIRWNLPGLARFLRRWDRAIVLEGLSLVVRRDQPLEQGIGALMRSYPNRGVRLRLAKAAEAMEQGQDWVGSLYANGLLDRADSAVLRAAQRVGNLAWALEEMADSSRRRLRYRIQVLLETAVPAVIVVYGIITLLITAGVFALLPACIMRLV